MEERANVLAMIAFVLHDRASLGRVMTLAMTPNLLLAATIGVAIA